MIGTTTERLPELQSRARRVRRRILLMAHAGKTPHVGSALSCVDLLVSLYSCILRFVPEDAYDERRDRLILSKGHGCMALYAVLAEFGFLAESVLDEYARDGGRLAEHPIPNLLPGIEVATGSLGHGLAVGSGLALAARMSGRDHRVFVLLSDGECCEGSVWEGALLASFLGLDNLIAIVDYNKWSAMSRTKPLLDPLAGKWEAFNWAAAEIDGHDFGEVVGALERAPLVAGRPTAIVAHTVKGRGVSFMEDDLEWHYRPPGDEDLKKALAEIDGDSDS